jgi:arylsulfatase A-like enzyme
MNLEKRPKNVILIFVDELRADALGCFGNHIVKTPNIDKLAKSGTLFQDCQIPQPSCTPCRASILSGVYPSALKSRMVGCRTPDDPRFIGYVLQEEGYHTASIGKIHLWPQSEESIGINQSKFIDREWVEADDEINYFGFREIDLVNGHGFGCFGNKYSPWLKEKVPDLVKRKKNARKLKHGTLNTYEWPLPPEVHSSNYIGDQATAFIRKRSEKKNNPFFLHISFPDPHWPFTVPEPYCSMYKVPEMPLPSKPVIQCQDFPQPYIDRFNQDGTLRNTGQDGYLFGTTPNGYKMTDEDWQTIKSIYYGMITQIDDNIGKIIKTLEDTGLDQSTIIIFVSDHGDHLGDHGYFNKGACFDNVQRTPLIISGPTIKKAQRIHSITAAIDIAPTIYDLLDIDEPIGLQSISMKPLLIGEKVQIRTATLTENDEDWMPRRERTITTSEWKMSVYTGEDYGLLFDRNNDPQETINLWNNPKFQTIKNNLMKMLWEEVMCTIDNNPPRTQFPLPPIRKWIPKHNQNH